MNRKKIIRMLKIKLNFKKAKLNQMYQKKFKQAYLIIFFFLNFIRS